MFESSEVVPEVYSVRIVSKELTPEITDNNGINFLNISGEKIFEIPPVMITDSSYDPICIPVSFDITAEDDSYTINMFPSDAIIDNNSINYPLIMSESFYTQINVQTFYNSEYNPNNTYYNNYIRFGNSSGHGYQDYVSCSNTFGGFGYYGTILEAELWMYMGFNSITVPKVCEVYSLNSQPMNCSWSNSSTLNTYNTKISDFTTSADDTYLWLDVDFTNLAQSWKNYADSSYAVGVPAYGFKMVTSSSPAATVSASSERASANHPYFEVTYSISSNYTLDYAPQKYDNIIDSSHGSIYNFQNRMNCYAYALQMYDRGTTNIKLNPGMIGLGNNPNFSTYSQLMTNYYTLTSLSSFISFTEQQMLYDSAQLGVNLTSITLADTSQFVLPSTYNESNHRIIAMNAGSRSYDIPNSSTPTPRFDFHFYVRHGNGTCGNPNHGSTCSKWSHKLSYLGISDSVNGTPLCDNNIAVLAKSTQVISEGIITSYTSTLRFYTINQNTNLYDSWYTYSSSTDTVSYTN